MNRSSSGSTGGSVGDLSQLEICPECRTLRGPWAPSTLDRDSVVQSCDCDRPQRDGSVEKWPKFDFNTAVELCYCCGLVPLRSGSRWSVWHCNECKIRVLALNRSFGHAVVPIGRHSLMHNVGLSGSDIEDSSAIQRFVSEQHDLRDRTDRLEEWKVQRVLFNLEQLGLDPTEPVSLQHYLSCVGDHSGFELTVESAFRAMASELIGRPLDRLNAEIGED